jgi:5-methylcytosine-specific restriction endonuclease McrA
MGYWRTKQKSGDPFYKSQKWRGIREYVLVRDGRICAYCHGLANSVDHVVPRSKGGSDGPENLVSACSRCNSEKNDRELPLAVIHSVNW